MEEIIAFISASILLTLSPGPDLIMVMSQALTYGFKKGVVFALGLCSGLIFHSLLLAIGWTQIIGENILLIQTMKWVSFIYFVFLGLQSIYRAKAKKGDGIVKVGEIKNNFLQGVWMNLINPKVSLFFWLFFPGFLFSQNLSVSIQYLIMGGIFILQAIIIFTLVAFFSSKVKRWAVLSWLPYFNGVLWISVGFYLLF